MANDGSKIALIPELLVSKIVSALSLSLRHHKVQITTKTISECAEIKCSKKVARVTKYQYFLLFSAKTKAK